MPKRAIYKERDVIRLIVSYEMFKKEHQVEYEDLAYLIRGYQQDHIRFDEIVVNPTNRAPGRLNGLIKKGFFRRSGKGMRMHRAYITLEGRERLHDLIDYIINTYPLVKFYRQDFHGGDLGLAPKRLYKKELKMPPEKIYKYLDKRFKLAENGRWEKKDENEITEG